MFYVAMTRAADWLYVCHPRRQASGYGNAWLGDTYEQTTLTRFITKDAQRHFECQNSHSFRPPADTGHDTSTTAKPKRTRRKSKKT